MREFSNKEAVSEICIVAPSDELTERCINIVREGNLDIDVYKASLEEGLECAKELINKGAKIIISRKGTKKLIEENCDINVVDISVTLDDYVPFFHKAIKENGKIAFFSYQYDKVPEEVVTMTKFFKLNIAYYYYATELQCRNVVLEAINDNVVFGVGGSLTEAVAKQNGLKHFIVESSSKSVELAIDTATQLLNLKKEESLKQMELRVLNEKYENVFNYTHDAIIAIDGNGKIDLMNGNAEKMFKKKAIECTGEKIDSVISNTKLYEALSRRLKSIDELITINNELILTNRIPIIIDEEVRGAVATFRGVEEFLNTEQKVRIKLREKGLYAKSTFNDIVGQSERIKETIKIANMYAKSDFSLLLTGETGTGKEMFAQSIHNASDRKDGPFVAINCSSIPRDLLESELFGYEEGAFTGAIKGGKRGVFELSYGGTLFLDEIGEISGSAQVQLLRAIQEKEIRKVGGEKIIPIDNRIIAATNKEIKKLVQEKKFREDLYYRINVLNIHIPPLRDRADDALYIAEHIFNELTKNTSVPSGIDWRSIIDYLAHYTWPGNVRELQNFVNRIYVLLKQGSEQKEIYKIIDSYREDLEHTQNVHANLVHRENWEKQRIIDSLIRNNMVMNKTAADLGISRTTLWRKIKEYDIVTP
ncbi:sigma-54-dependent Fis family transcriptional regulator [Bacillota bacterium]